MARILPKKKSKKLKKRSLGDVKLPTEPISGTVGIEDLRMLLYGPPKVGKSTLCSGFDKVLFLATEKGYEALKGVYVLQIRSWEDFKKAASKLYKGGHDFKTIAIDTIDILISLCAEYVCNDLNLDHISDADWGKGYDMFKKEFEREINKLFMGDLSIILVSHTKTMDMSSRGGSYTKTVTTMPNYARRVIIPKVSVIGMMRVETTRVAKGKYKTRRILSFQPSEFDEAGDRHGRLPSKILTYKDPHRTYEAFKKAYAKKKKKGGKKE